MAYWQDTLQAPAPVLDWIQNGYKLPLFSEPPRSVKHNQQSALANKQFVDQAVTELLNNGCVCRVSTIPHVCSPLSVVTSTEGKKRLVINLRYLNQYLRRDSFKYEDLHTLMAILMPNDFLFKFDLKSGYHHVEIFQPPGDPRVTWIIMFSLSYLSG